MIDDELRENLVFVEGSIHFLDHTSRTETAHRFRHNSVNATYRALRNEGITAYEHRNEWIGFSTIDKPTDFEKKPFVQYHRDPRRWNYGHDRTVDVDEEATYEPHPSKGGLLAPLPNIGIHWKKGDDIIDAKWFRWDHPERRYSFVAVAVPMYAPILIRKLGSLTSTLCTYLNSQNRSVRGVLSVDGAITKEYV
ncbi:hypothetical protein GF342_00700 [Candidatus Woesearchaeota archaeon]|nr:hypothetical protein [Candidatus Woesearchaeota archaeon]